MNSGKIELSKRVARRGPSRRALRRALVSSAVCALLVGCHNKRAEKVDSGCAYTETAGRCELVSTDVVAANSNDPSRAALRLTYRWVGELPPEFHDRTKIVEWEVPQSRVEAARAHAAAHADVPCKYAVSTGSCPPYLSLDAAAVAPPPDPPARAREAICPPNPRSPLNTGLAGIGTAALLKTFPPILERASVAGAADWRRESDGGAAAGTAGRWADEASAVYAKDGARVRVVVDDMIRVCSGATGSTDTLLDTEAAEDPDASRRRTNVHSRSAVFVEWQKPSARRELVLWIADRCRVTLEAHQTRAAPEELIEVARGLDLGSLDQPCARR